MRAPLLDSVFPLRCAVALLCAGASLLAQEPPPAPTPLPAGNTVAPEELSVAAELPAKEAKAPTVKAAGVDLPKPFPVSRYSALLEKSPFAVATAAPEAAPPTENFSTNFVITGLAKNRGADGKEVHPVFVRSRDLSTRLVLTGDKPSDDGISVVSVEEAAVAAKSVVVLKRGRRRAGSSLTTRLWPRAAVARRRPPLRNLASRAFPAARPPPPPPHGR